MPGSEERGRTGQRVEAAVGNEIHSGSSVCPLNLPPPSRPVFFRACFAHGTHTGHGENRCSLSMCSAVDARVNINIQARIDGLARVNNKKMVYVRGRLADCKIIPRGAGQPARCGPNSPHPEQLESSAHVPFPRKHTDSGEVIKSHIYGNLATSWSTWAKGVLAGCWDSTHTTSAEPGIERFSPVGFLFAIKTTA